MNIQSKISHRKVADYVARYVNAEADSEFDKIINEDPVYKLLFNIIHECCNKLNPKELSPTKHTLNHTEIEDMLWRVVANPHIEDAELFLVHLISSPNFYHRILQKLSLIAPGSNTGDLSRIAAEYGITMKTDEELMAHVFGRKITEEEIKRNLNLQKSKKRKFYKKKFWQIASGIPIGAAAVFAIYVMFMPSNPSYIDKWKSTPPYLFSAKNSSFSGRGEILRSSQSPGETYKQLIQVMEASAFYYNEMDYKNTVEQLKVFENNTQTLLDWSKKPLSEYPADTVKYVRELRKLVQDYYFMYGISHLAYSTQKDVDLKLEDRHKNQQRAIELLSKARDAAVMFNINTDSRETYYAGLSHKFKGDFQKAIKIFESIRLDSQFKQKAESEIKSIKEGL